MAQALLPCAKILIYSLNHIFKEINTKFILVIASRKSVNAVEI